MGLDLDRAAVTLVIDVTGTPVASRFADENKIANTRSHISQGLGNEIERPTFPSVPPGINEQP